MQATQELKIDETLDLKGLLCPIPVVKLATGIKKVAIEGLVKGIATDPGVMADIPAWCRTTGNELVSIEQQGKEYHFIVRRKK